MNEREKIMRDDLDGDVVDAIRKGKTTLSSMRDHMSGHVTERMLDRSLQRLRRTGQIRFVKGHWYEERQS